MTTAGGRPAPLRASILPEARENGWRRTIVYAPGPLLSDLPIIALVVTVLALAPPVWVTALRFVGGGFLLYLAFSAFRSAWKLDKPQTPPTRGLLQAVLINLLNPNPYLFWSLITGPILVAGWKESPVNAVGMLAGFYITMILLHAVLILIVSIAHRWNSRLRQALIFLSAVGLAVFGVYQVWMGITGRT